MLNLNAHLCQRIKLNRPLCEMSNIHKYNHRIDIDERERPRA